MWIYSASAALSTLPSDVSTGKGNDLRGNAQGKGQKSSAGTGKIEDVGEREHGYRERARITGGGEAVDAGGSELIQGKKWERTPAPERNTVKGKRGKPRYDVSYWIGTGRTAYGMTKAESDTLHYLLEVYNDDLAAIWNAYERGGILISEDVAAAVKAMLEYEQKHGKSSSGVNSRTWLQKVGDETTLPDEWEKGLRDGLVDTMRGAGIDVVTDEAEGQRVLDEANGRGVHLMGTRVERRKAQIAAELQGRELTAEQQAVVDVFTGSKDNQPLTITDKDGKERRIVMRQGNEHGAGTKHSIFGHYGTSSNQYKAEEILFIPDIIKNGERKQKGGKVAYEIVRDGVTYTVTTEQSKSGLERFTNFYTNRKPTTVLNDTSNTDEQHASQQSVSSAKLQKVPEKDAAETEKIFNAAKKRFGTTQDLREAGYILPDGTMLDFSGRHQMDEGADTSGLRGQRAVDHRDVKQLNYEADGLPDERTHEWLSCREGQEERGSYAVDWW